MHSQAPTLRVGLDMISAGSGFAPATGGMTSYYEGLLNSLSALESVTSVVAFVPPWQTGLAIPDDPKLEVVECLGLPSSRHGRVLYEHCVLPRRAKRAGVDILLSTCNVKPLLWRGPSVVVLQSVQYFFLPSDVGRARLGYLRFIVPKSLRDADLAIAVSEDERERALELFGLDADALVTVHHGVPPWALRARNELKSGVLRPLLRDRPYLLTVSALYEYKNHRRLIEAFAEVVEHDGVEHDLLIAGRDADVSAEALGQLAAGLGVGERVVFLGPVPQSELPSLVAGADAIAYVSLYETFGLPVLEAFALGRPLVTSNVGGAAEIAGDAAELVDPWSVDSIARGLAAVLGDPARQADLSVAGDRRLDQFTWSSCAAATTHVLISALEKREAAAAA